MKKIKIKIPTKIKKTDENNSKGTLYTRMKKVLVKNIEEEKRTRAGLVGQLCVEEVGAQ